MNDWRAHMQSLQIFIPWVQLTSSLPSMQSLSPLHTNNGCRGLLLPQVFVGFAVKTHVNSSSEKAWRQSNQVSKLEHFPTLLCMCYVTFKMTYSRRPHHSHPGSRPGRHSGDSSPHTVPWNTRSRSLGRLARTWRRLIIIIVTTTTIGLLHSPQMNF